MNKYIIYIDANVYLRFFDTASHKLKGLLKTVVELREYIFVSEQIREEVLRNKLNVAIHSFNTSYKALGMDHAAFPEHLEHESVKNLADWNRKRNKLMNEENLLKREYSNIVSHTLNQIVTSTDNVSKELDHIFSAAKAPSDEEMRFARLRKDCGNPPGKVGDPLGDQLSWEQLLGCYKDQTLWVVTNDSDYLSAYDKKTYLNPLLYRDLVKRSGRPDPPVYLFRSLPEALDDFRNKTEITIKSLPKTDEMKMIKIEEAELHLHPIIVRDLVVSSNINSIGYDPESSTLEVEFINSGTYQYYGVPEDIYLKLRSSASIGKFFHDHIKNGGFDYKLIK